MPSPFDAIDADMQAALAPIFGEGIRIMPRMGDNYTSAADPARPERVGVLATVARAPGAAPTDYSGSARNGAQVTRAPGEVWIDQIAYAAIGYEIQRGDLIAITDDPARPPCKVVAVHAGEGGDVQIILG